MSPSKQITKTASAILAGIGVLAIVTSFGIGISGWPPASAHAAVDESAAVLGTDDTTVILGDPVLAGDKFGSTDSSGTIERSPQPKRSSVPAVGEFVKVPKSYGRSWRTARVSWYGPGFYGHGMAGGGKLRRNSMVVAHKTLPFGTKVQFVYRGRTVTAVVRDRGPFVAGRAFDLGPGIAKGLHFGGVGTVHYRILKKK